MKYRSIYIARLTLALFLLLLTIPSNIAQRIVFQGCTTKLNVLPVKEYDYKWELYKDSTLNFAVVPGNCPPDAAHFIGESKGDVVYVKWLLPGTYYYKVAVQDATRCTNNIKIEKIKVTLTDKIKAVISGNPEAGLCQEIILNASKSEGNPRKYEWLSLDPGISLSPINSIETSLLLNTSFRGTLPASFRIKLQVTSKEGQSASDLFTIKIYPPPAAIVFIQNQPQIDGTIVVDGTSSNGKTLSYFWSTKEGRIIGPNDKSAVSIFGIGDYLLEVTDTFGCKSLTEFKFPTELYKIIANPDTVTIHWSEEKLINVLENDYATAPIRLESLKITSLPSHGTIKINPNGSILYIPTEKKSGKDQFVYQICDALGLCSSATVKISVKEEDVKLIQGFSPNGDGVNDLLVFNSIGKYPQSSIYIYSRSGQLVFHNKNYKNDWDGTIKKGTAEIMEKVPTGVYYYILELGGTNRKIRGYIYIGY